VHLRCQLSAGHLRHDLVRQNQIEPVRIGAKRRQRLGAERRQHLLARVALAAIASARASYTSKTLPTPGRLVTFMAPPWSATMPCTVERLTLVRTRRL
jgi:hypothetical protein